MPHNTWLIYFEDASMWPEIFTEESAAIRRLQACRDNWACHLFVLADPKNAAAPELYATLNAMTEWAGGIDADKLPPPWPEMVANARAALAKARGEQPDAK